MGTDAREYTPTAIRLGGYEVVRRLAHGGMAELYLARAIGPQGFEKLVVLKRILARHAENPRFVRLFLDEAKLVAGFDHPHIAHVYDMGTVDGSYFFTMEFVHGADVRATLRRCKRLGCVLAIEHVVLIARNIAAALHYAHERRGADGQYLEVVHRDVSPSNIIVSFDGVPKLIDFGIAKAATSTIKTQTGALKGKISYMSPEQAKGAPIDRRSDIFSLGIVLWEMIACRRLYKAENDLATIQRIIYEAPPSPVLVRPDCPPELERIVLRALSLEPDARYRTAQELQVDLDELAREHRLGQSSVALSKHMRELFADELASATESSGSSTVTDGVVPGDGSMTVSDALGLASVAVVAPDDDDGNDEEDEDDLAPAPWGQVQPGPTPPMAARPEIDAPNPPGALSTPAGSHPSITQPKRRRWLLIGASAVIVAAAGVVIAARRSDPDAPTSPPPAPYEAVAHPQPAAPAPVPAPTPTRAEVRAASPVQVEPELAAKPQQPRAVTSAPKHAVKPARPPKHSPVPRPAAPPVPEAVAAPPTESKYDPNAPFPPQ